MSLKTMKHLGMILSSYKLLISHHHLKKMCVCVFFFGSMHDAGCLGLVHWDDPEGWYGEGGGRRVQVGEHMRNKGIKN